MCKLEGASPAAVKGGCGTDDFNIAIGLADYVIAHLFLLIIRTLFENSVI